MLRIWILFLIFAINIYSQSPHGDSLKSDCYICHVDIHQGTLDKNCQLCHNTNNWTVNNIKELHQLKRFPLVGVHQSLDCLQCHSQSNIFNYGVLGVNCYDCHKNDYLTAQNPNHVKENYSHNCYECHRIENVSWKSENKDHSFFPLIGAHNINNCFDCHIDSKYTGLNKNCVTCHLNDYNNAQNPNHILLGFNPNECDICHTLNKGFKPAKFDLHNQYFALVGAHTNLSCNICHKDNYAQKLPTACFGCHENDFNNAINPPHTSLNFSHECTECHTQTSWANASFNQHSNYFPIFSGAHNGVWSGCNTCHINNNNYSNFECITCHEHNKAETDIKHANINGYRYSSIGCVDCHPNGIASGAYNHALSGFLLTGAHIQTRCNLCHTQSQTPNTCSACHLNNYNLATNPNHQLLNFGLECSLCHTTEAGWNIYQFPIHNNFYTFNGAHVNIKDNCQACHKGNYINTSSECSSCHLDKYTSTTNPPHQILGFSTKCDDCHNQNAWKPALFNHDLNYFPIFTGTHTDKWDNCNDCHRVQGDYSQFSCIDCHAHNNEITDDNHAYIQGYVYNSKECVACHPTGIAAGAFNHANALPLIGAHGNLTCDKCHLPNTYTINKTECKDCHINAFYGAQKPNHVTYGFSIDCNDCHTTDYGWKVYQFDKHNEYYPLIGKHNLLITSCNSCHPETYQSTPTSCYACHYNDYINSTNPKHQAAGFGQDCSACHTPQGWQPSTFLHDNQYFPIYIGEHAGSWNTCYACHTNENNLNQFSCIGCHVHNKPEMDTRHNLVSGYYYSSNACLACHPTGVAAGAFNHANSALPLLGVHATIECSACHTSNYSSLDASCYSCHANDYNSSANPNHIALSIPQDCSLCHNPTPRWSTDVFPIHNNYYSLIGAHAGSNVTCYSCHNGDYNNTPNTCVGCHLVDYNNALNPNHIAANFPMECEMCHTQYAWIPANFNHDNYFPIFSGTHQNTWNDCAICHNSPNNYTEFECTTCHEHNQALMDLKHANVNGYIYKSLECFNCHPNGTINKVYIKMDYYRD